MKAGEVFVLPDYVGAHFNFILKVLADGSAIVCNFTEHRRHSDTTCIVKTGEHECITKQSVAYFEKMYVCPPGDALDALERQIRGRKAPLSPELLARLQQGALDSPHTPPYIKELLAEEKQD